MTIREILLKLSGKEISIKELEKLVDQSKNDKPVNDKLTKVVQLARSKKINRFIFKIEGAFKTLLGKKAEGKSVKFDRKDFGALEGLETYTKEEALSLGIIEGLGKLPYKDVYKTINQEILTYLKEDSLVWRKPWKDGVKIKGQTIGAQNYVTQRPYSGVNAYLIWLRNLALKNDYKYFLTAKQVKERGGVLKKDAKGIVVVAFIRSKKVEEHPEDPKLTSIEIKQGLVQYLIYPLEQTTGVKPINRKTIVEDKSEDQIIVNAQTIIDGMPKLPIIKVGGSRAFYTTSGDYVQMPPKKAFNTLNEYYSTLFHELVHSTGAEKRLNRKFKPGTKFGDKDYAFEELIAELGAAYLCGVSDIKYYTLKNSAAYLKSWASALRSEMAKDKTFFFRAVMSATKAAKYIVAETIVKTNPKTKVSVNKRKSNVKKTPINAKKNG
jgi:antirestriction protein ArdC